MSKVVLKGFIIVPDRDLEIVKQELPVHSGLTREESGCLVFEVTPNESNPNRFDVYEEFASRAAFDAHQVRVKSSRWGQVTSNVERHYKIIESEVGITPVDVEVTLTILLSLKGEDSRVVTFPVPASSPVALGDGTAGLTPAPQA